MRNLRESCRTMGKRDKIWLRDTWSKLLSTNYDVHVHVRVHVHVHVHVHVEL